MSGKFRVVPILLAMLIPILACAASSSAAGRAGDLRVSHAWSRATPPGLTIGVIYLDIENRGDADVLQRVEAAIAKNAEIHETFVAHGVTGMRMLRQLSIPAHTRVRLRPDGLHIMLRGLTRPLSAQERFPVSLAFKSGRSVTTEVEVVRLDAPPPTQAP